MFLPLHQLLLQVFIATKTPRHEFNYIWLSKKFIYKAYYFFRNEAIHVVCRVSEKIIQRSRWDFLRRHQALTKDLTVSMTSSGVGTSPPDFPNHSTGHLPRTLRCIIFIFPIPSQFFLLPVGSRSPRPATGQAGRSYPSSPAGR